MGLETKLLIIPCCQAKAGTASHVARRSIDEFIGPATAKVLHDARAHALMRPGTSIDPQPARTPALFLYSGAMYEVEGFRTAILAALGNGLHVLVESGGYGLIRVEELIVPLIQIERRRE